MTGRESKIYALISVLQIAFQAKQTELAEINRLIMKLVEQHRQIDQPVSCDPESPAIRSGADLRWAKWAESRKILINQELALAYSSKEQKRAEVSQALARLEAARKVRDNLETRKKAQILRRANH